MIEMPSRFERAWRSGAHVGPNQPTAVVQVQKGHWRRRNYPWAGGDVDADIPGETRSQPFYPKWEPHTEWVTLPGVEVVRKNKGFDQRGGTAVTIVLQNVGYSERLGPLGGVYHLIENGYLAPFRGYTPPGRPRKGQVARNEWYDVLARRARIRIWQGYGEPVLVDGEMPLDGGPNGRWTVTGTIDDVDLTSAPHLVTITARDSYMLTDQRLFGWTKSRSVLDPVTFAPRQEGLERKTVGSSARGSSDDGAHPARFVLDTNPNTRWESQDHSDEAVTEWVEIRLPKGTYTEYHLHPAFSGMEMFVGVYVRPRGGHGDARTGGHTAAEPARVNGDEVNEGWLNLPGGGEVPGAKGGWRYIRRFDRVSTEALTRSLGATIETGDNSILRIGFRKLAKVSGEDRYRAGVVRLTALRYRPPTKDERKQRRRWIFVDDISDMVKVALRWAGFEEWEVESTGVGLKGKFVVNRSSFLTDIIEEATKQTGFVFYLKPPTNGESHGVPVFRRNGALAPVDNIPEIRDTDLLTGIQVKVSEEPLAYNIRIAGRVADQKEGGVTIGATSTRRILCYYKPPWARAGRLSGVLKHVLKTYNELRTFEECQIAAYLVAIEQALEAVTATCEVPGNPFLDLDEQVGIVDTGTGMNTRLWVTNVADEQHVGQKRTWKTTIGGAFIDTPDVYDLMADITRAGSARPPGIANGSPGGYGQAARG